MLRSCPHNLQTVVRGHSNFAIAQGYILLDSYALGRLRMVHFVPRIWTHRRVSIHLRVMGRIMLFAWLSLTCASAQAQPGPVTINEISFLPDAGSPDSFRRHCWVEIHNRGANPVDLSGWIISTR